MLKIKDQICKHGESNVFNDNFSNVRITSLVDTHGNILAKNTLSTYLSFLQTKLAILASQSHRKHSICQILDHSGIIRAQKKSITRGKMLTLQIKKSHYTMDVCFLIWSSTSHRWIVNSKKTWNLFVANFKEQLKCMNFFIMK